MITSVRRIGTNLRWFVNSVAVVRGKAVTKTIRVNSVGKDFMSAVFCGVHGAVQGFTTNVFRADTGVGGKNAQSVVRRAMAS